jgi:UDP-3-O-[3-hydroxymyristoyl] glucosamine N-acyltransferase
MMKSTKQFDLSSLVKDLDVVIKGDANTLVTGIAPIQCAALGDITFLTNSAYKKHLKTTQASVVILSEADAALCDKTTVVCKNPHYIYAKIAANFKDNVKTKAGIHPTAVIGDNCSIDKTASIGAHCVIGDGVTIGANTILDASVTIYDNVTIGARAHISSGVVVGSDGFGFANEKGAWHEVPQLGGVIIGDDVSIGANTVIDRGALEDTVIENGVKLDNLIQVAHNVRIGAHTIIAGCVAIAGSTTIGAHCMVGGATCFAGHITIADKVIVTGMTSVTKSITEPGMYSSGIVGAVPTAEFRKHNARFYRLENLMERVKTLETELKNIKESQHHE